MKLTGNQSKKEEQAGTKQNFLVEIYYKRLDKLDNMLVSLISIIGIIFTVIASVMGGVAVLYLLPIIVTGVFLPIYFGYYKVIFCNDYYKSLRYRITGWCFFIDATIVYFISSLALMLRKTFPYIDIGITLICTAVIYIVFSRFHTPMIVCNIVECNDEVLEIASKLRIEVLDLSLYYFYLWYGIFNCLEFLKYFYESIISRNLPLIVYHIIVLSIISLIIVCLIKRIKKSLNILTNMILK